MKMNNKGVTLVELLVYIVIAGLLLVPIMFLMRNSSVNMARDAVTTGMQMSGRDVINMMHDDIRNLGYKLNPEDFSVMTVAYFDTPNDSSSFLAGAGNGNMFDVLTFKKGRLNDVGQWDGVDSIVYYVTNDTLIRDATFINDAGTTNSRQILAHGVVALQFEYAGGDMVWRHGSAISNKRGIKNIRASFIQKDPKQIAAARRADIAIGNIVYVINDEALYELHQIVIPVPNNGLFLEP